MGPSWYGSFRLLSEREKQRRNCSRDDCLHELTDRNNNNVLRICVTDKYSVDDDVIIIALVADGFVVVPFQSRTNDIPIMDQSMRICT